MVFTNGEQRVFYRTTLGVAVMIMQQLTGINLITYYTLPPDQYRSVI